jgi:hypothetical protein
MRTDPACCFSSKTAIGFEATEGADDAESLPVPVVMALLAAPVLVLRAI